MDFTYFLPWKYAGFRFQGAGLDLSTQFDPHQQQRFQQVWFGQCGGSVITGEFYRYFRWIIFWPSVDSALYKFGGGGGLFTGAGGNTINTCFPGVNNRFNNASTNVLNNRGSGTSAVDSRSGYSIRIFLRGRL